MKSIKKYRIGIRYCLNILRTGVVRVRINSRAAECLDVDICTSRNFMKRISNVTRCRHPTFGSCRRCRIGSRGLRGLLLATKENTHKKHADEEILVFQSRCA